MDRLDALDGDFDETSFSCPLKDVSEFDHAGRPFCKPCVIGFSSWSNLPREYRLGTHNGIEAQA